MSRRKEGSQIARAIDFSRYECKRVGVQACISAALSTPLALASERQGARDKGHGIWRILMNAEFIRRLGGRNLN